MKHSRFFRALKRRVKSEDGASIVEFTIVITLFLLVFFALLDFGRLGFNWVMTEKAMQRAARIVAVRPPICTGVPETHSQAAGNTDSFGALCRTNGACTNEGTQACVLSSTAITDCVGKNQNASTAEEIWCILEPILPSNATPQNIKIAYSFDSNLGFLGGPYTPQVEVGIVTAADTNITNSAALNFTFITPLGGLASMMGGNMNGIDSNNQIPFPDLTVSLPGEDLAQGNDG